MARKGRKLGTKLAKNQPLPRFLHIFSLPLSLLFQRPTDATISLFITISARGRQPNHLPPTGSHRRSLPLSLSLPCRVVSSFFSLYLRPPTPLSMPPPTSRQPLPVKTSQTSSQALQCYVVQPINCCNWVAIYRMRIRYACSIINQHTCWVGRATMQAWARTVLVRPGLKRRKKRSVRSRSAPPNLFQVESGPVISIGPTHVFYNNKKMKNKIQKKILSKKL